MPVNAVRDADELIAAINVPDQQPRWAWWAPGDATLYQVTLLNAARADYLLGTPPATTLSTTLSTGLSTDLYAETPPSRPPVCSGAAAAVLVGTVRALVATIDALTTRPTTIVVPRPPGDRDRYTPAEWVARRLPGGWWPGIRPLLAALGWTPADQRNLRYRPTDHRAITTALGEQLVKHPPRPH